jgi:putative redox protein
VSRSVNVNPGRLRYLQNILIGPHAIQSDEPVEVGGSDAGPDPYELLMAALGSCASITVRMYAERKQWSLEGVRVDLSWRRVHAGDCLDCDGETGVVDGIQMELSVSGDLTEDQRLRLLEIANRCPVHRTLSAEVPIRARLIRHASI